MIAQASETNRPDNAEDSISLEALNIGRHAKSSDFGSTISFDDILRIRDLTDYHLEFAVRGIDGDKNTINCQFKDPALKKELQAKIEEMFHEERKFIMYPGEGSA